MLFVVESSRSVKKEDGRGRKWAVRRSFVTVKGNRAVQARSQLIAAVWLRVDPLLLLLTWTL